MRPVGQFVIPIGREPAQVSAVVVDGIELLSSVEIRGKNQVAPVRGPAGRLIPCVAFREFDDLFGPEIQNIQVEYLIYP